MLERGFFVLLGLFLIAAPILVFVLNITGILLLALGLVDVAIGITLFLYAISNYAG